MTADAKTAKEVNLYDALGLTKSATSTEVRRAYRSKISKNHPDKGGDAETFAIIQRAYDVLSDEEKRGLYDAMGRVEKSVEEELLDEFGGGVFKDKMNAAKAERESLADAIVKTEQEKGSHSAGFEAWMRARGDANKTFGVDDIIDKYGVVKGSYDEVPLPKIQAFVVDKVRDVADAAVKKPSDMFELKSEAIPGSLEWGQILLSVRAAPINPGDLASNAGAEAGGRAKKLPHGAGGDFIAVVMKVGAGCSVVSEGDWVIPAKPGLGAWRSLACVKEKEVIKIPTDLLPVEHAAMLRELCVAYRLLEDNGDLKPGDAVMLNGATGTVGAAIIQLCSLLKLRAVAVVRRHERGPNADFDKVSDRLKNLGAAEVLPDEGNLRAALEAKNFFAKPKLALDCVGGVSASRLVDSLQDGCPLVCFGCLGGRPVSLPWHSLVARGLSVRGFSLRRWMTEHKKKTPKMMSTVAKLVNADKLKIDFTEYELSAEFQEACEHAAEAGKGTKILLRVNDIGATYA